MGLRDFFKRIRASREFSEDYEAERNNVYSMSTDAARIEALTYIADPAKFKCERSPAQNLDVIKLLGYCLREFFTEYETVEVIHGESSIRTGTDWKFSSR
jgi:hypothetical protein